MNPRPRGFQQLASVALLTAALIPATIADAQSTNRQIGTQFTVTADPLVPRPDAEPCVVPLFQIPPKCFSLHRQETVPVRGKK
jgi:hypothetical protein